MKAQDIKNLKYRYLLWLYKTVKEELDRIDRKFTQLDVDQEIFKYMTEHMDLNQVFDHGKLKDLKKDFEEYMHKKEKEGEKSKLEGGKEKPDYYFLSLKLKAIEDVIVRLFGAKARTDIKKAYEKEMRKRILKSTEH